MSDRGVRSLAHLETSASTARVLNLRAVHRLKGNDSEYIARPMFKNRALNTSIIVKHRLRGHEADQFRGMRRTATKILIPIENGNLRLGARYVFVGEQNFEEALQSSFGVSAENSKHDLATLAILDKIPTLDPFLLREQLLRYERAPARCYFDLSYADTQRMFEFVRQEIEALVQMSIIGSGAAIDQAARLTHKILSSSADAGLEPLRLTMRLDRAQFQEGMFCWKAFLYYKWQIADLLPCIGPVLDQIATVRTVGPTTGDDAANLAEARGSVRKAVLSACRSVKSTLDVYDEAYAALTHKSDACVFRDFLLKAPILFHELGERLAAIEHIISFWRFRFPKDKAATISAVELKDIFADFEGSLGAEFSVRKPPPAPSLGAHAA